MKTAKSIGLIVLLWGVVSCPPALRQDDTVRVKVKSSP